jgi:hypothetical protein
MRPFAIHRRMLLVAAPLVLAACGGAAAPQAPDSGFALQDDFSSTTCLFGFLEAATAPGCLRLVGACPAIGR